MTTQTDAAVTTAVQDTNLNGKTMGEVVNDLNRDDLKKSYKAIDAAYDLVIRKDGIEDTQRKLTGLQDQVGEKVYDVLKLAIEHCEGKLPIVKAYFAALCKKAEEYFLSKYVKEHKEETTIAKAIPLWPAYKTSLTKGLDYGMSPDEPITDTDAPRWPTAAKFRTEVMKREKEEKGGNAQPPGTRNTEQQTNNIVALVSKGWSVKMTGSMSVLVQALNRLTHEEQDKFAQKVLDLGAEITTYANAANREAMGDTRTAAQKAAGPETTAELDPGTKAAFQAAIDKDVSAVDAVATAHPDKSAQAPVAAGKGNKPAGKKGAHAA
jgi:hypothetical protein